MISRWCFDGLRRDWYLLVGTRQGTLQAAWGLDLSFNHLSPLRSFKCQTLTWRMDSWEHYFTVFTTARWAVFGNWFNVLQPAWTLLMTSRLSALLSCCQTCRCGLGPAHALGACRKKWLKCLWTVCLSIFCPFWHSWLPNSKSFCHHLKSQALIKGASVSKERYNTPCLENLCKQVADVPGPCLLPRSLHSLMQQSCSWCVPGTFLVLLRYFCWCLASGASRNSRVPQDLWASS